MNILVVIMLLNLHNSIELGAAVAAVSSVQACEAAVASFVEEHPAPEGLHYEHACITAAPAHE